jgi:hypothetical protein
MKCPECKGRGHFLFVMSTPPCESCGGTGEAADRVHRDEFFSGFKRDSGPLPGLEAWLPETFSLEAALIESAGIGDEARRERLDEDERRLREAIADYAADDLEWDRCGPAVWDADRRRLDVPMARGGRLAVSEGFIAKNFRTAVSQRTGRLLSVDVRHRGTWARLRTFETEGAA